MNREQIRQAHQLAFAASGQELQVGDAARCPLPPSTLAATVGDEPYVHQRFESGLTARVYRLRVDGRDWTLKVARPRARVHNVDGQTSFLNEVQRRADIQRLKDNPATAGRMAAMVDTVYASYRQGIILSPWIEGETVRVWDERRLSQLFDAAIELALAGLFEWDLCSGNLLDDGRIRLFDFGYMYRFDPLTEFNSNGLDAPLFHVAERFETRTYFAELLRIERERGQDAALEAFRMEKRVALDAYERLLAELRARGASAAVLDWIGDIVQRWRTGLRHDPAGLYLAEGWRSHRLDLDDDLRGQSCTPMTLARCDWLSDAVLRHEPELRRLDAFFWDDKVRTPAELALDLDESRVKAQRWQIVHDSPAA